VAITELSKEKERSTEREERWIRFEEELQKWKTHRGPDEELAGWDKIVKEVKER
jgi:hypothetical protein